MVGGLGPYINSGALVKKHSRGCTQHLFVPPILFWDSTFKNTDILGNSVEPDPLLAVFGLPREHSYFRGLFSVVASLKTLVANRLILMKSQCPTYNMLIKRCYAAPFPFPSWKRLDSFNKALLNNKTWQLCIDHAEAR